MMVERELSTLSATEASAVRLAHEKLMAPVWVSVPREGFMPGDDLQIQKADHRIGSPVSPPSKIEGQRWQVVIPCAPATSPSTMMVVDPVSRSQLGSALVGALWIKTGGAVRGFQGELLWCSSELNDAPPPAGRMEALQLATPHDQAESFFWDGELGFMFEDKFFVVSSTNSWKLDAEGQLALGEAGERAQEARKLEEEAAVKAHSLALKCGMFWKTVVPRVTAAKKVRRCINVLAHMWCTIQDPNYTAKGLPAPAASTPVASRVQHHKPAVSQSNSGGASGGAAAVVPFVSSVGQGADFSDFGWGQWDERNRAGGGRLSARLPDPDSVGLEHNGQQARIRVVPDASSNNRAAPTEAPELWTSAVAVYSPAMTSETTVGFDEVFRDIVAMLKSEHLAGAALVQQGLLQRLSKLIAYHPPLLMPALKVLEELASKQEVSQLIECQELLTSLRLAASNSKSSSERIEALSVLEAISSPPQN